MSWKFWQNGKQGEKSSGAREEKLAKPKEIPERVGMHLVSKLKEDPDWVWSLKAALRPKTDEKHAFDIRIFNPADTNRAGASIANYNSLDAHPEMILFFGSFNKKTGSLQIEKVLKNVA